MNTKDKLIQIRNQIAQIRTERCQNIKIYQGEDKLIICLQRVIGDLDEAIYLI